MYQDLSNKETQALIIGAGPTGLTMAAELARHGIKSRIIDKASTPSKASKAFAIHARTLELFENIGIIQDILEHGNRVHGFCVYNQGKVVAELKMDLLESKYPFLINIEQSKTEQILISHLRHFGIEIEWQKSLINLSQDDESVTAEVKDVSGKVEHITTHYLCGCDGTYSTTRKLLNIDFQSAPYPDQWLLADLDISWNYPSNELATFISKKGTTAFFPLKDHRGRLMFQMNGKKTYEDLPEASIQDVKNLLKERGFKDVEVSNPTWISWFKLHHKVVNKYSKNRVFLLGDAAHIHSPLGGQGMNTGIQDAYNLAWKMGLVLHGSSPKTILDSYEKERLPVAEGVGNLADRMTKMIGVQNPVLKLMRDTFLPIMTKVDKLQNKIMNAFAQIEVHYKDSPIVSEQWHKSKTVTAFKHPHEDLEPGERVGNYALFNLNTQQHTDLYALFTGAEHELLLFTGLYPTTEEFDSIADIYTDVIKRFGDLIETHLICGVRELPEGFPHIPSTHIDENFRMHQGFASEKASLYLIRPDGYVAFRNQPIDPTALMEYLSRIYKNTYFRSRMVL